MTTKEGCERAIERLEELEKETIQALVNIAKAIKFLKEKRDAFRDD